MTTAYDILQSLMQKKQIVWFRIDNIMDQIERYKIQAEGLSGSPLTGMPHAPSGEQDKIGGAIADMIDYENTQEQRTDKLFGELANIDTKIKKLIETFVLDEDVLEVMMHYYVFDNKLDKIPVENANELLHRGCNELKNHIYIRD